MPRRGEAKLGLKDAQLIEVNIHHGLFQLGQTEFSGLHSIPIGHINEINLGHILFSCGIE